MINELAPQNRFDVYVGLVRRGLVEYGKLARELAAQHGFPLEELTAAWPLNLESRILEKAYGQFRFVASGPWKQRGYTSVLIGLFDGDIAEEEEGKRLEDLMKKTDGREGRRYFGHVRKWENYLLQVPRFRERVLQRVGLPPSTQYGELLSWRHTNDGNAHFAYELSGPKLEYLREGSLRVFAGEFTERLKRKFPGYEISCVPEKEKSNQASPDYYIRLGEVPLYVELTRSAVVVELPIWGNRPLIRPIRRFLKSEATTNLTPAILREPKHK